MKNKLYILFLLLFFSFDAQSVDCSAVDGKINLEKIVFQLSKDGSLGIVSNNLFSEVRFRLETTTVSDSKIAAIIQLRNSSGEFCKSIKLEVDPTLLCKDADGVVEPWTYWVYQADQNSPPEYSVVSTRTILDENAFIRKSRLCGYSTFEGRVVIDNSNVESTASSTSQPSIIVSNGLVHIVDSEVKGKFLFEEQSTGSGEIILRDTTIDGKPEIKSLTNRIFLEDVDIIGDPKIEEKAPVGFTANAIASVFMKDVTIMGNPQIKGGAEGLDLNNVIIEGSPTITGEAFFENVRIENNGFYSAKAEINGSVVDRSSVLGNILKGNSNNFSGLYYINKHIENSTIEGTVVRNSSGNLANIANLNNLDKKFVSSKFKGIGYISGDVQAGTIIHGDVVSGNYSGINFCSTCSAYNASKLSGAFYTSGEVKLDHADVSGTSLKQGLYVHSIWNSLVQNSNTTGASTIVNSEIKDQSVISGNSIVNQSFVTDSRVSGNARLYNYSYLTDKSTATDNASLDDSTVTNNSLVKENAIITSSTLNNSVATCNAYVEKKSLLGASVGCNYPNKKNSRTDELIHQKINENITESLLSLRKINIRANELRISTIRKYVTGRGAIGRDI